MSPPIKEQLRAIKRSGVDSIARLVLRFRILERLLVSTAHRYPNLRIVQWICDGVGREALGSKDQYRVVMLKSGSKMIVDISDMFRYMYFYGMDWESETTEVIMQLIRPGDIVFDIGANLGYYTLLTAGAVGPAGQVHSFEPNPNLATVLIEAVKLNSYHDRVFINQIALSDRTQERAEFYISQLPQESGLSSLSPHPQWIQQGVFSPSNTILVDTITLDEYFVERHIERCDLVKIDVEGTEYHVIGGMRKVLRDIQPKFIICETRLGGEADTLIRQFGFVPYIITESGLKEAEQSSRVWGNILYVASSSCSYLP